jgi:hypothetical protein
LKELGVEFPDEGEHVESQHLEPEKGRKEMLDKGVAAMDRRDIIEQSEDGA